jgi:hypothetical protein
MSYPHPALETSRATPAKESATVLEIAYEVGFSNLPISPSVFSSLALPSKFAEREAGESATGFSRLDLLA